MGDTEEEANELAAECRERGIDSFERLLNQKLAPLSERISDSQGGLIAAITCGFDQHSWDTPRIMYSSTGMLHVGIIGLRTRFPSTDYPIDFLTGVDLSHYVRLDIQDSDIQPHGECFRDIRCFSADLLLGFMERPPNIPQDADQNTWKCEEPRLRLYIGDDEVLPVLQEKLMPWQYLKLSGLLGREFPVGDEMDKRIGQEQETLFNNIRLLEERIKELIQTRDGRIKMTKADDGAIFHQGYIELTDEFVERIKFNPEIEEQTRRLMYLVETAVKRGYHNTGRRITRKLDAGVTTEIDLKRFFSDRMQKYEIKK